MSTESTLKSGCKSKVSSLGFGGIEPVNGDTERMDLNVAFSVRSWGAYLVNTDFLKQSASMVL